MFSTSFTFLEKVKVSFVWDFDLKSRAAWAVLAVKGLSIENMDQILDTSRKFKIEVNNGKQNN